MTATWTVRGMYCDYELRYHCVSPCVAVVSPADSAPAPFPYTTFELYASRNFTHTALSVVKPISCRLHSVLLSVHDTIRVGKSKLSSIAGGDSELLLLYIGCSCKLSTYSNNCDTGLVTQNLRCFRNIFILVASVVLRKRKDNVTTTSSLFNYNQTEVVLYIRRNYYITNTVV